MTDILLRMIDKLDRFLDLYYFSCVIPVAVGFFGFGLILGVGYSVVRDPQLIEANNTFRETVIQEAEAAEPLPHAYNLCVKDSYDGKYNLTECPETLRIYAEWDKKTKERQKAWKRLRPFLEAK